MTQDEYDRCWHDPVQLRILLDQRMEAHPELFPECLRYGYAFHGMARPSRKLGGWRLRKIRATGSREAFHLRPSFILPYMTGTIEDVEKVLFLASFGVPCWALTKVFGRDSMYWQRLIERLGRNSLVGTTVRDPERLPEHLAADEHHVDWSGEKGYVDMTVGGGCILGVALTDSADEERLTAAYGEFAAEAREVKADYAPKTVNTDGWFATQNAFRACFSTIVVILCFLHGFLKIRDRCRKDRALHERVWKVYCSSTAAEFDQRMREFGQWFDSLEWTKPVREAVAKLRARTAEYAMAYDSPGCARTSNAVDRPMNRLSLGLRGAGNPWASSQFPASLARLGSVAELSAIRATRSSGPTSSKSCASLERKVVQQSLAGKLDDLRILDGTPKPRTRNPVESEILQLEAWLGFVGKARRRGDPVGSLRRSNAAHGLQTGRIPHHFRTLFVRLGVALRQRCHGIASSSLLDPNENRLGQL